MKAWIISDYDTLSTTPNRDGQYYLMRHLRRKGKLHVRGGGRLARFGSIAKFKHQTPRDTIEGRIDRVFAAEYRHYVWRVRPLCAYCAVPLTRATVTKDHVVPRSRGGSGGDNLVPACGPCNRAKGNRSLLLFLMRRRDRARRRMPVRAETTATTA